MKKIFVFLLSGLLLASCASIPTSGPINSGMSIGFNDLLTNSRDAIEAPQPGMSKLEIAAGFLEANANALGDFSVAREYLASFIDFEWLPQSGMQVFETQLSLIEESNGNVIARGIPILQIDQQFRPSLPGSTELKSFEFSFTKENDEWRIVNPPTGILISSIAFQRNYGISNLWFVDKDKSRLVPDFLVVAQKLDPASQLIRALSAGSGSWLKPAVLNMLDFNLSGGLSTVQRQGDNITIDFDVRALRMTDRERVLLISQISQTLVQLPDLATIRITAGGQLMTIPNLKNPLNLTRDKWIGQQKSKSSSLFALSTSNELFKPLDDQLIPSWISNFSDLSDIAIMADGSLIAAFSSRDGIILFGSRNIEPTKITNVSNISDLNFGSDGKLWFINRTNRNLYWFDGSELREAQIQLLGESLRHAAISPDNVRLASVSQLANRAELSISRIRKSQSNLEFVNTKRVISVNGQVLDLDWYSATQLVLLVNFPTQLDPVAVIVDIATASQTIFRLPSDTTSLNGNSYQSLVASTRSNEIWIRSGSAWSEIARGELATFSR
jgi:hypothetical protein